MSSSQTYLSQIRQSGDRLLLCVVGVLLIVSFALAPLHGTWTEAFVIGLPTAGVVAWRSVVSRPSSPAFRRSWRAAM